MSNMSARTNSPVMSRMLGKLLLLLIGTSVCHAFTGIVRDNPILRVSTILFMAGENDEDKDIEIAGQIEEKKSTLDVIKNCMGTAPALDPAGLIFRPTEPGISGFAVDADLGFVAILTNKQQQRCAHVVVSPKDRAGELSSPEALCMVQLSGGMDLGTPVFPPDCLATLVADELESDDPDAIRSRLELLEVRVEPSTADPEKSVGDSDSLRPSSPIQPPPSSAERTVKLSTDVPKFMSSVKNLPGLQGCTEDQVLDALKLHADEEGAIDRSAFAAILDTLRRNFEANETTPNRFRFELVVSLDGKRQENPIPVSSVVHAIGLSIRYEKKIILSEECKALLDIDTVDLLSRFPTFKPIQELREDAKKVDAFIPSMFVKGTAPKADDRA